CSRARSQVAVVGRGECPAHHHPREQVEDHRQVELAAAGEDLGDVAHPALVGPLRLEAPVEDIGRHRLVVIAHRRAPVALAHASLPSLVRAALVHVQFETIHPFLDGNGRIGRLLITLLLEHWKLLSEPLLYLSLFFKRHRPEYYRLLNAVCLESDWEAWVSFFLE